MRRAALQLASCRCNVCRGLQIASCAARKARHWRAKSCTATCRRSCRRVRRGLAAGKHVQLARLGTDVCGAPIRRLHHHRSSCRGFAARPASGRRVRPPGWVPTCMGAVPRLAGVAALVRGVACSSQTLRRAGCAPPCTALPCSSDAGTGGHGCCPAARVQVSVDVALPLQVAPMWREPSLRTLIRGIGIAAGSRVLPASRVAVDGGALGPPGPSLLGLAGFVR